MRTLEISEGFCETFQCKKLDKINVCNNLQHVLLCIIQCEIQMTYLINSQKIITVQCNMELTHLESETPLILLHLSD